MELALLMGVVGALNFGLIFYKLAHERVLDAGIDFCVFIFCCVLFFGTATSLAAGMVTSGLVSLMLLAYNPTKVLTKYTG